MEISNLTRQHKGIEEVLDSLSQKLKLTDKIAENAFALTILIANLAGRLKIHLGTEDKYLYPELLKSPEPNVKSTTLEFIKEMGDLAQSFENYKSKYMNAKNIRNNPEEFVKETKTIIEAIIKRINKEEVELYTLL